MVEERLSRSEARWGEESYFLCTQRCDKSMYGLSPVLTLVFVSASRGLVSWRPCLCPCPCFCHPWVSSPTPLPLLLPLLLLLVKLLLTSLAQALPRG